LDEKEESEKRYDQSHFVYDEEADQYTCPESKPLVPYHKIEKKGRAVTVYRATDGGGCPVKSKGTKAQARTITREGREPLPEKMQEKLRSGEGKKIYQRRSWIVEPVFGNRKWSKRQLIMSRRGQRKVKGEFLLRCLAHPMEKVTGLGGRAARRQVSKIQTVAEPEKVGYQPMMAVAG